jgi:hypothetical protein
MFPKSLRLFVFDRIQEIQSGVNDRHFVCRSSEAVSEG